MKDKRIAIRVSHELHQRLLAEAARQHYSSISEMIRRTMELWLEDQKETSRA